MAFLKKIPFAVSFLAGAILITTFYSCNPDESEPLKGEVLFSLNEQSLSAGRKKSTPGAMVVTVKDASGNIVHNLKKLEVLQFGDEYISEPLSLEPGDYTLTGFLVADDNDVVILATPLEGSDLAHLVDDPAPIAFSISKDNVTNVNPEVVAINENLAADFGYVAFSFNEVATFSFAAAVFKYNASLPGLELTSAHVTITSGTTVLFNRDLQNITNTIVVRDGADPYKVKVTKAGYLNYEKEFTASELKAFSTAGPLMIVMLTETLADGLVAWFPFNGNAQDESGNANHGVVNSASLTTDKAGTANRAYQFNGSAYIQIPSEDLTLEEFTYSMWVNSTSALPTGFSGNMFSVGDQYTSHHQCLTIANQYASALATGWFVGGWNQSPTGLVVANVGTNSLPAVNQWAHIVWVRSHGTTTMYFNNQLIGTVTTNDYPAFYGTSVVANIGMRCNYTQGFIGKIDNFRIYSRTLSASEVAALYNE